jgi:transposase
MSYKDEIESGKRIDAHENYYKRYFIIKNTKKGEIKVTFNDEEFKKERKIYCGYFCLLSTKIKDPVDVLMKYRNKDVVENCFDNLKNHLDMSRLRVSGDLPKNNRLFLQFLALILNSKIRKIARGHKILRNMSVKEIVKTLESLEIITYEGRYKKSFSEFGKNERIIFDAFDLGTWPM